MFIAHVTGRAGLPVPPYSHFLLLYHELLHFLLAGLQDLLLDKLGVKPLEARNQLGGLGCLAVSLDQVEQGRDLVFMEFLSRRAVL